MLAIALGALALIGSPSTWVTLTVAGLAMGLLIFIMASGLTLVFGLMDVMNFAHGLFIAVGAYVAASTVKLFAGGRRRRQLPRQPGRARAGDAGGGAGRPGCSASFFERVIIKPVYGQHLKQILITTGGMIVAEQLIHVFWGPDLLPLRAARDAARLVPDRRHGDREVPPDRGGRRPRGVRRHAAAAQPHQDRPADPRRRREQGDGRGDGLPHPAPVRRRVRRRLGAGGPGRRAVGHVPGERDGAHRRAT